MTLSDIVWKVILSVLLFTAMHSRGKGQENIIRERKDSIYLVRDTVLIPTRSEVDISAIVVRNASVDEPRPAILFYTTYEQGPRDAIFGKRSADRGYVGIVAYTRGIRTNLRHYLPFEHEGTDIYDIIDWISKQPWCNGKMGMFGGSYTGFAQWAAAKSLHPALKTIVPQVAVMPGFDFPMENNVPVSHILHWSHDNIFKRAPLSRSLFFDYYNEGVAFNKLDSLAGHPNAIFQRWLQHPDYDSYWKSMVPGPQEYARINIPVLTTTGYYDGSQISALEYFRQHNRYAPGAEHYLVIGPYDHYGAQRRPAAVLMDYAIDSVANLNMMELAYHWLDHILLGKPRPVLLKAKVNYQVMGTNEWKHVEALKDMNNDTLRLYLNQGRLSDAVAKKSYMAQQIDFRDRERQHAYYTPSILFDSLDASNGLVFSSDVAVKDYEINGSFFGKLMLETNKRDMDISLALYEQLADGKYFFLTRYAGRASYARDPSKRQLLRSGITETIPFGNTRMVSKRIRKGSRMVVLLNVNKHPFEIINYGSGKPVSSETMEDAGEPMQIKWHNSSYIMLPVKK